MRPVTRLPIDAGGRRPRRRRMAGGVAAAMLLVMTGQITTSVSVAAADGCHQGKQAGPGGHRYELVCAKVSWSAAKTAAIRAGGHLVTIADASENAFVATIANVPGAWSEPNTYGMVTGPWIGFFQAPDGAEPAGGWGWVTGEPVAYTHWAAGEPNDFEGSPAPEDRAVLWGPGGVPSDTWNDIGAAGAAGYVIEYEPPLKVDWTMPEHLTVDTPDAETWRALDGLPGIRHLDPAEWKADVFLRQSGAKLACPAGTRYAFTVKPLDGGRVLRKPAPGCSFTLHASRLGRYKVSATRQTRSRGTWKQDAKPAATGQVLLKDYLIVGLGDSNGSGEGNPGSFYYDRCNRGTASYQFQTALYVEQQDPRSSVSFIHASCSGARIEHLVDRGYAGTRPANPPLDPQIEQVSFLLSQTTPRRSIDAVLLSVGVNDLSFGPLMKFCVLHGWQTLAVPGTPCPELGTFVETDARGRITAFQPNAAGMSLRDRESRLLSQLPGRYPALARALKAPIAPRGGLDVAPNRVFITQYPDFMHGADGNPCDTRNADDYAVAWGPEAWTWLSQVATQLNKRVRNAASAFGWRAVPASSAFATRGYCNLASSLVVGLVDSVLAWNMDGAFHPNAEAHRLSRDLHAPLVCARINTKDDCTGKPR